MEIKKGIGVSPGVVISTAVVLDAEDLLIPERHVPPGRTTDEITRFHQAVQASIAEVQAVREKMAGTIGRSQAGIDFAALDHQPVYTVMLLLSPENQPQQHLQAMNVIFNNLQKDMFRRFLRQSTTRQAIQELLEEADQGK